MESTNRFFLGFCCSSRFSSRRSTLLCTKMISELFLICALSLSGDVAWKPPLTVGDQDLMSFMRALSIHTMSFVHKKTPWEYFTQSVTHTPKGGVLFIEYDFGKLEEYFKGRDWERFPFKWRDYYIYRKRGYSA
jgi:hypothetical protein